MAEAARHAAGRLQNKRERSRRGGLEQAELAVVDAGVDADFAQVAAQQGQVVLVVDATDAAQALDSRLIVQMADQRVAGIGRYGDDAAGVDDLRRLLDQARLRIDRVDLEKLAHGSTWGSGDIP